MVEALNTCRNMHTTHNKKQHMHEYAHAEGEQANKESGYREGGNKEHTDTQTQRGSAQTTNTNTHMQCTPGTRKLTQIGPKTKATQSTIQQRQRATIYTLH